MAYAWLCERVEILVFNVAVCDFFFVVLVPFVVLMDLDDSDGVWLFSFIGLEL